MRVDEGGRCVDHRLERCVGFVGAQGDALELFEFAEDEEDQKTIRGIVFLTQVDQVTTFVKLQVDGQGVRTSRVLGNADHSTTFVHLRDDPVAVEGLVGQHRAEADPVDQGGHADGVKAVSRQQDKAHEVAKRIGQRQYLGGPAALRLAYRLTLSPPFEPCPWR